jgi:hypothetical protein
MFRSDLIDSVNYRQPLTENAMLEAGECVRVIRETAENINSILDEDGILSMRLDLQHNMLY